MLQRNKCGHPYSEGYIDECIISFKRLLRDTDSRPETLEREKVIEFLLVFSNAKNNQRSNYQKYNRFLSHVRIIEKFLEKDLSSDMKFIRVKEPSIHNKIFYYEEIQKMLKNPYINLNIKSLIMFLWDSGCRIGEALHLRREDVDFKKCRAKINDTKTGEDRIVFMSPQTSKAIDVYLRQRINQSDIEIWGKYTTVNYRRLIKRAFIASNPLSNIEDRVITPHCFRHSRAYYLKKAKVPSEALMEMFGWNDFNSLRKYGQLTVDDLQKIYKEGVEKITEEADSNGD